MFHTYLLYIKAFCDVLVEYANNFHLECCRVVYVFRRINNDRC